MELSLPVSEMEYLSGLQKRQLHSRLAALHARGWSLSQLASALQPPRPKTTVHFWVRNAAPPPPSDPPTPVPPITSPRNLSIRSISPKVPPDQRPILASLSSQARRYRSGTPENSETARANRELTSRALQLRDFDVPTSDIAPAARVSYRAIAKRIKNARL